MILIIFSKDEQKSRHLVAPSSHGTVLLTSTLLQLPLTAAHLLELLKQASKHQGKSLERLRVTFALLIFLVTQYARPLNDY